MLPLILIVLSMLGCGIQSVMKMLPSLEKGVRVLHIVLTAYLFMAGIMFC